MKKLFYSSLIFSAIVALSSCASQKTEPVSQKEPKLLLTVVKNMAGDKTIFDSQYDSYFKEGSAKDGIASLILRGAYRINSIPIPKSQEEFYQTGFLVNENEWLKKNQDGTYTVDRANYNTYIEAALALIERIPSGLETRLYDTDGDNFADEAESDYFDAIIVNKIVKNPSGSQEIKRSTFSVSPEYSKNIGRLYDGSFESVAVVNIEEGINEGDVALLQKKADGYHLKKALEVKGVFTGGGDHEFYEIDGKRYQDAMRYSRDNIIISNRPGEYANVRSFFGFTGNNKKISLWLSPVTQSDKKGAPVSLTSGENAEYYLTSALEIAKEKLENANESEQASKELSFVISLCNKALQNGEANDVLDFHTYLLFLALNGSKGDIGAEYGGYNFTGFSNK